MQEAIAKMRPNIHHADSSSIKCPVCGDSGYTEYQVFINDLGNQNAFYNYAEMCPKCFGINLENTNFPYEFLEASLDKFNFDIYQRINPRIKKMAYSMLNDWDKWQSCGRGLYLYSKTPGSGKSFLACCIARSIMVKYGVRVKFITAPDYIASVGDSYKRERGETDISKAYRECPFLILDDIGAQIDNKWYRQELFKLIKGRQSKGLMTLYTSNVTIDELGLDDRTKSIIGKATVIPMPEESIRKQKAKEEEDRFFKEVLGWND